ncbi:MAG TPA: hypothetical protein VGB37_14040 [Candidatus Lokiarchaeia archaeon]
MLVNFCDRCGIPMRGKVYRYTREEYTEEPKANFNPETDDPAYQMVRGYSKTKEFEVCDTCGDLIEQILEIRQAVILQLAADLKHIYELKPKIKQKLK